MTKTSITPQRLHYLPHQYTGEIHTLVHTKISGLEHKEEANWGNSRGGVHNSGAQATVDKETSAPGNTVAARKACT